MKGMSHKACPFIIQLANTMFSFFILCYFI